MSVQTRRKKLVEMAKVIRSKNSGPFKLTLDVIFDSADEYRSVKGSGRVTRELIAGLYGIEPDLIAEIIFFDPASAIKVVLPRPVVSGGPGDTDVYGAQQHAPLLALSFEIDGE